MLFVYDNWFCHCRHFNNHCKSRFTSCSWNINDVTFTIKMVTCWLKSCIWQLKPDIGPQLTKSYLKRLIEINCHGRAVKWPYCRYLFIESEGYKLNQSALNINWHYNPDIFKSISISYTKVMQVFGLVYIDNQFSNKMVIGKLMFYLVLNR